MAAGPFAKMTRSMKNMMRVIASTRGRWSHFLRATAEESIELYGVWAENFIEEPKIYEEIPLGNILGSNFYFKERGFYRVIL
jgi:hypothetical protein